MILGHCRKCGKERTCSCGESGKIIAAMMGYASKEAYEEDNKRLERLMHNSSKTPDE